MPELSIYLLALTSISLWVRLFNQTFDHSKPKGKEFSYIFSWIKYINFKPINCQLCLSVWVGIILAIWLGDIIYLSLGLIHLLRD